MPEAHNKIASAGRTRRNIIAMAAIAGAASLTKIRWAAAQAVTPPIIVPNKKGSPIIFGEPFAPPRWRHSFLKGTKIRTALGERKVEELAIGDQLPTAFGGTQPIQWIGRYRYQRSDIRKTWVKDVLPVRSSSVRLSRPMCRTVICS